MPWAWRAPFSFVSNLLGYCLSQQGPRIVGTVEGPQRAPRHFPAVLPAPELPAVGADPVNAKAGRCAVAGKLARGGVAVGCNDLQVRRRDRPVAIQLNAWQPGEMTETAGDRSLVLGRPDDGRDRLVSTRAFAAAKIDLAISGEGVAVVSIGAGIGGRRMACNEMIDRQRVFDRAQAILQRSLRLA